eukprot:274023-Rhodomonas_salina.4
MQYTRSQVTHTDTDTHRRRRSLTQTDTQTHRQTDRHTHTHTSTTNTSHGAPSLCAKCSTELAYGATRRAHAVPGWPYAPGQPRYAPTRVLCNVRY